MANPHRGEAAIKIGDVIYTLVIGRNALAETEGILGKSWVEIAAELQANPSFAVMRALFWASLQRKHPCDLFEAGDLMDVAGDEAISEAIGTALRLAFPDAEPTENPQKPARRGAGKKT